MNSTENKSFKAKINLETVSDYPNFSKEDMQKLKYMNNDSRNKRELSKLEWMIKCFIHRVKKRIETFLSWFSSYDEV